MLSVSRSAQLTDYDFLGLKRRYISEDIAIAAGLRRVDSLDGRDIVGRKSGDYGGIAIDYRRPGSPDVILTRLRLDHPPVDPAGKPEHKYLSPPGARNHVYYPPCDPALVTDLSIPLVWTEGEFKGLAGHSAAIEAAQRNGNGQLPYLCLAIPGVFGFRSVIGKTTNARGERTDVKGVIPDIQSRIPLDGRKSYICYDTNTATNPMVCAARSMFARVLEGLGATVYIIDLPPSPGINGMDDFLYTHGLDAFMNLFGNAARYEWRNELARSGKGKILPTFSNALTALRLAPEWRGVLGFNEFALIAEARKETPWGGPAGRWSDDSDLRTAEWLEGHGIPVGRAQTTDAVITVAREHPYHPVREYLDGLKWDGVKRLDGWLTLYLGVDSNDYTRAIGVCWPISGVARIYEPGCKADHALILESPQGAGKTSALETLGGEFYSDDLPDLGTKDAAMGTAGVWLVELAELDAMARAEISKIKAFLSRRTDRYRPPYGRHLIEVPRQCVFAGSVNHNAYLKDETGGRRFWPVEVGKINLAALRRDKDQLWAEAVVRYRDKEPWWLDSPALIKTATEEQEGRYQADPWEPVIETWLLSQTSVTTADVLEFAIKKDKGQWSRADESRVGIILRRLKWKPNRPSSGTRRRTYCLSN